MPKLRIRILAGLGAAAAAVVLTGVPAFAGSITVPATNPYTVPLNAAGTGPAAFPISVSGYVAGTQVFSIICDGTPSSASGWSPTINCDNFTSPQAAQVQSDGTAMWNPAVSKNQAIGITDGPSKGGVFACDYPGQLDNGVAYSGGTVDPNNGLPTWTNCQLRVASTNGASTSDQAFVTLTLQAPAPVTPEAADTFLLPIGAAVILGGAYLVLRRRRHAPPTAA